MFLPGNIKAQSQGLWSSTTGNTGVQTNRQVFVHNSAVIDSSLTANLLLTNAAKVFGLAQIDNLLVNGTSHLQGILTLGAHFTLDGNNSSFTSSSGFFNFGNTDFTNVGNVSVNGNVSADTLVAETGVRFSDGTVQITAANFAGTSTDTFTISSTVTMQNNASVGNNLNVGNTIAIGAGTLFLQGSSIDPSSQNHIYTDNADLFIQDGSKGFGKNTIINANGSSGNVGIGTVIPGAKFEISSLGDINGNTLPIVRNTHPTGGGAGWTLVPGGGSKSWIIHATGPLNTQGQNKLIFKTKDTLTVLTMQGDGLVGIGTAFPGTKLHVESSDPTNTIQSSTPVLYLRNADKTLGALTSISFRGSTSGGVSYPTAQIGTINTPGSGVASGEIYFATTKLNGALAEAMRITSGGNIGIGTATPNQLIELRSAESTTRLRITNDAGPANGGLEFYAGASFKGGFLFNGGGKVMSFYGPSGASGVINMHDNGDIVFNQGSTAAEWVRIKEGNVGIGTTSPVGLLHISSASQATFILEDRDEAVNDKKWCIRHAVDVQGHLQFQSLNDDNTVRTKVMTLSPGGNVGIGATGPQEHLHISGAGNQFIKITSTNTLGNSEVSIGAVVTSGVGGQIDYKGKFLFHETNNNRVPLVIEDDGGLHACKVIINTAFGCDFVFDEGYNLRSLKKRKEITFRDKRLWNMKPASIMVKNGMDIGETSIGILQILEEHELYLYQHDEKIEKHDDAILLLIEENKELKKENAQLKKLYEMLDGRMKENRR